MVTDFVICFPDRSACDTEDALCFRSVFMGLKDLYTLLKVYLIFVKNDSNSMYTKEQQK